MEESKKLPSYQQYGDSFHAIQKVKRENRNHDSN